MMKIGNYIKQTIYRDLRIGPQGWKQGSSHVYKYGIVLEIVSRREIIVIWLATNSANHMKKIPYTEKIKMEMIEIISEIR